jgi:hypothetical protein
MRLSDSALRSAWVRRGGWGGGWERTVKDGLRL